MKFPLILSFLFACVSGVLRKGEIAFHSKQVSPGVYEYHVTDGKTLLEAFVTTNNGVKSCRQHDGQKLQDFLQRGDLTETEIGAQAVEDMFRRCSKLNRRFMDDKKIDEADRKLAQGKPFDGDFETGEPEGSGKHMAIFPGTKWCGYENVANSYDDLGVHNATDTCCRTHDHCPYYIDRFETKYNYFNNKPWTVSHCDCDSQLYNCLKEVDSKAANEVGSLFYGLLDVQCFKFANGTYCAKEHWTHLWCQKTAVGPHAVMHTFPHKWSDSVLKAFMG